MDKQIIKLLSGTEESEKDKLIKALLTQFASNEEKSKHIIDIDTYIDKLQKAKFEYEKDYNFKVGDIVKWKVGLKNKRVPNYDEPAIVVELLNEPIFDIEEQAGSPYFKEPLNIRIGLLDEENEFMIFHYDKNRFEPLKK